ncbi:MAG TPA: HAD family phosphatase, partial [Rhodospirillales bacterium]|nr:HAD family phosphatase [Rhodospirillales bacterium]
MALVSSASQIEIEKILNIENIAHYFSFKIGNEDVLAHKPHPMPYLKALKQS